MTLYFIPGQGVVDDQQGVPADAELIGTYRHPSLDNARFQWDPARQVYGGSGANTPGYLPALIGMQDRLRAGQLQPYETEWFNRMVEDSRAIPTRDIASLTAGWQGEDPGSWGHENQDWWTRLDPGSPDVGPIMLQLREKLDRGQATPQERQLYGEVLRMGQDWDFRASRPQESDANPFGLGDNLFGALFTLGLGASGGLAAAPLAAGGASLGTTLGSLGSLSGTAGQIGGLIGGATGQDWLANLGKYLGALGGIAGGVGGLTNLAGTGVNSLADAARLAQSAGRITGGLGTASGVAPFQQAGRYLGYAGQAGQLGAGAADWLGWGGTNAPLAANVAPTVGGAGGVQNLLSAADVATQRGGGSMDYWGDYGNTDWLDWSGGGEGPLLSDAAPGIDWGSFASGGPGSWMGQVTTDWANGPLDTGGGGGGGALGFLGKNAGTLGPLASTLGGVASGALGSNAAREASAQQTAALNRGIDLQTAQWLQQQANQAPWLAAGQAALPQLQQRAAEGRQAPFAGGNQVQRQWYDYGIPSATPGWTPQNYQGPQPVNAQDFAYTPGQGPQASQYGYQGPQSVMAGDYRWSPGQGPQAADYRYTPGAIPSAAANRWTPGQGPSAADYRYTPGQTPDAAAYASGPPQLYRGAMPGTQVSTLTGQQVLDQDPGAAFRQTEARRALESSAAARGGLLSGSTLQALQARSQDLASQEYGNAWQRMMSRDVEQYGRNWGQYQQAWNQGVQGTQLGLQTNAQNFGQAMSAAQLREQLQQVATQQGWSQAQTEAAFREQMAQQASQQGFGQQMSEADMRERVNQVATQQGWSQAQAEAVFREQMAQQASSQGFQQALGAQGQQWQQGFAGSQYDWQRAMLESQTADERARAASTLGFGQALQGQQAAYGQGLQSQQWNQQQQQQWSQEQYQRMLAQNQLIYGRDTAENQTNYERELARYNSQTAANTTDWNRYAALAGLGQTATNQIGNQGLMAQDNLSRLYGQLGTAQGTGTWGQAYPWQSAITGAANNVPSLLRSLNA